MGIEQLKCWFHSAKPFFLLFFPPSVQLLALGEIAQIVVIPRSPIVVQVILPRLYSFQFGAFLMRKIQVGLDTYSSYAPHFCHCTLFGKGCLFQTFPTLSYIVFKLQIVGLAKSGTFKKNKSFINKVNISHLLN